MSVKLEKIPGIRESEQTVWKVRALSWKGKNLALSALTDWEQNAKGDYKKIMKVLKMLGQFDRLRDPKKVKKSENEQHERVYEIRADKGNARLMFFYTKNKEVVVVTNPYWKTKQSKTEQNAAFEICNKLRKYYENE